MKHELGAVQRIILSFLVLFSSLFVPTNTAKAAPYLPLVSPSDLSITISGYDIFFMDLNKFCESNPAQQEGPDGLWLPIVIQNTHSTESATGLQVTVAPPANINVDDEIRFIGDLGPSETAEIFYFFDYFSLRTVAGCDDGTDDWYSGNYTITITSLDGGLTIDKIQTDTFSSKSMISANAGGAFASDWLGPGTAVGQIFSQYITYDFGNNPTGSQLFLQPTGNHDF